MPRTSDVTESDLAHVVVVGGTPAEWLAMSTSDWEKRLEDLADGAAVEGALWVTVMPHHGADFSDEESADLGADSRRALMLWGRKAVSRHPEKGGLNWVEIWGLDEILTLFGFPEDPSKPVRATVLRGFLEDEAPSQNG